MVNDVSTLALVSPFWLKLSIVLTCLIQLKREYSQIAKIVGPQGHNVRNTGHLAKNLLRQMDLQGTF